VEAAHAQNADQRQWVVRSHPNKQGGGEPERRDKEIHSNNTIKRHLVVASKGTTGPAGICKRSALHAEKAKQQVTEAEAKAITDAL